MIYWKINILNNKWIMILAHNNMIYNISKVLIKIIIAIIIRF
jgi:hypothetical protein